MPNSTYHKRGELVHGYRVREHPLYSVWANMKSRCNSEKDISYVNYGGRGIKVCEAWIQFKNFAEDMWPRPEGMEIDRIDNDAGYSKENCHWVTQVKNAQNKRVYKTNKTGVHGTREIADGRFACRVARDGVRYNLGRFSSSEEAESFRSEFETALKAGETGKVQEMLARRARYDSTTGIKGITPHVDGGFLVRKTVAGERKYLGYRKTFEEALELLNAHGR